MFHFFHMFRRLRKMIPSASLLNMYKTYMYVQSKIDYGLSIWGCATEVNLNRVQRIPNLLARIICNNFDYTHSRGIDLVRSIIETPDITWKTRIRSACFNVQMYLWPPTPFSVSRRQHACWYTWVWWAMRIWIAPSQWETALLCNDVSHWLGTIQGALRIWCTKDIYKRSFLYKGISLWNKLPPWVKESMSLNDFKHN